MSGSPCIGDLIEIPPVRTVIRLADRFEMSRELTANFVLTSEVDRHLTVIAEALALNTGKGYFLQGDFGSGKSHFLAALAAWLAKAPGEAELTDRHTALAKLSRSGRRFLPVDIPLIDYRATTSLEKLVILRIEEILRREGVDAALTPLAAFINHLRTLCEDESIKKEFADACKIQSHQITAWLDEHPRQAFIQGEKLIRKLGLPAPELLLEERHETLERAVQTVKKAGFDGIVLLVDELSEFFRSKPDAKCLNEDARMLQLLGEFASSSPLWIVAAVQESLERTGDIAQVTFRKIKDRFPVRLRLSTVHIRDLLSKRLIRHKPGAAEKIRRIFDMFRQEFPAFECRFEHFLDIYPVHPVTLGLLEGLGDLFSQHRGIVDFVFTQTAGAPERNVPGILDRPAAEMLAPDSIYKHFEPRLAEFSDFNLFPRHIVPHLDNVIEQTLHENHDRTLCRRLVRILVLYHIHPTAAPPTLRRLTELVGCVLAPGQPDLNLEFVGEVLLDPVVAGSSFLVRNPADTGHAGDTVYKITTEEKPDRTLKARIERVAEELDAGDTRLLTAVLPLLPQNSAWPGKTATVQGVTRTVTWRNSTRKVLLRSCCPGEEEQTCEAIAEAIRTTSVDFGLILATGHIHADIGDLPVAVWHIPEPEDADGALRRWFATRQISENLKPGNPADAPLIEPARETLRRLTPLAKDEAIRTIYNGSFTDTKIAVEPAALQMRRFDRLIDAAGMHLLDKRYPRFAEIAPRGIKPSPRLCQRLVDELFVPGRLSLQEARQRGLTSAIEGIAAQLGLIEVKGGVYLFAPDPVSHPLLSFVMSLLRPAAPTPRADIYEGLKSGQFGMPEDTITFLLTALASAGLVTLLRGGRSLPLEFLRFVAVEKCDEIAPGDLVSRQDRDTLNAECRFLAPAHGWETFGLKQQREAWQNLIAFKKKTDLALKESRQRLKEISEFSAFRNLDLRKYRKRLTALEKILEEVKISYPARDGLERFLSSWRQEGLKQHDVEMLKRLHSFLQRNSDSFIFLHHYLSHPAVETAAENNEELEAARNALLNQLQTPEQLFSDENGRRRDADFDQFRTSYTAIYCTAHDTYWQARAKPELSRIGRRARQLLQRLSDIDAIEQPPGLPKALEALNKPGPKRCKRHVAEQLLRAPVCDCGFQFDKIEEAAAGTKTPESLLDGFMQSYAATLSEPPVLEALEARAFALKDASPAAAGRLRHMIRSLRKNEGRTPAGLFEILDQSAIRELEEALAGSVTVVRRQLKDLVSKLTDRRLRPAQIHTIINRWLDQPTQDALISIDGAGISPAASDEKTADPAAGIWAMSHRHLFPDATSNAPPGNIRRLEARLQSSVPAAELAKHMTNLPVDKLINFIADETCHTDAIRQAWQILFQRFLDNPKRTESVYPSSSHLDREKAGRIAKRLQTIATFAEAMKSPFPERLSARISLATLIPDSWTTDGLIQHAAQTIESLEQKAEDWLHALPPVPVIDLKTPATVAIIDGVAPDVWLTAMAILGPDPLVGAETTWFRLQTEPDTVASLSALFGLKNDPVSALHARGIAYYHLTGRETHGLCDTIPEIAADRTSIIRITCLDHDAHQGTARLAEMPAQVADLWRHQILPLQEKCRKKGLGFILTTDHGMSLDRMRLSHHRGGVYEKAIFRATWP